MKDYQVTEYNYIECCELLQKEIEEQKLVLLNTKPAKVGIWGLARLWRSWMAVTAEYMAGNGCTMPLMIGKNGEFYGKRPFNASDAHELFTHNHMGCDNDGVRLSWAKNNHDGMRVATKGERVDALRKHEQWCIEKGIKIFKPRDSEYQELEDQQNE